jgi:hypothetical protein
MRKEENLTENHIPFPTSPLRNPYRNLKSGEL